MPLTAERATIRGALPLDAEDRGRVEGIGLRAVAALARAHALALLGGRLFHAGDGASRGSAGKCGHSPPNG